jgi:hypothetical protein
VVGAIARPSSAARIKRSLAIVAIFVLLGPPVGAVTLLMTVAVVGMGSRLDVAGLARVVPFALIYGIPFGYLIGVTPAAAVGILFGTRQAFFGPVRLWTALAIGTLAGVTVHLASGQALLPNGSKDALSQQGPVMIVTCIAATMVCWAIVRNWYFAEDDRESWGDAGIPSSGSAQSKTAAAKAAAVESEAQSRRELVHCDYRERVK